MPVAVVIELAAVERGSPHVPALVEACNRASAETACSLARSGGEDPREGGALAVVAWGPEHRVVRIEVALRRQDRAEWFSRSLDFRSEDAEVERWRAVGLVIATVVGVATGGEAHGAMLPAGERPEGIEPAPHAARAPEPVAPTRPAPTPPAPGAAGPKAAPSRRVAIDLFVLGGPALDDGSARVGGGVRGAIVVRGPVFAALDTRFAWRRTDEHGVTANWASAGAGVGARVGATGWLDVEGRGVFFGQLVHASVLDPATKARDAASRSAAGGLVAFDLLAMPHPAVGGFVGLDLSFVPGSTEVAVGGRAVGAEPVATFVVHAGGRVAF